MLVSYQEGEEVQATPGFETIKTLPSFTTITESVVVGMPLKLTVDLFDCPGVVVLVHDDATVIDAGKGGHDKRILRQTASHNTGHSSP